MKERMNILFCCDANYAIPLTVCITSIFENNKESELYVYILYSSLTEAQKVKLNELARDYSQDIVLFQVEEHYFSTAPTLRWSKETYYRLLINELLPHDLERILYLDCDIIINKSLHDLYTQPFNEKSICALRTEMRYEDYGKRLNLPAEQGYFQCGVLLFDVQKCSQKLSYQSSMKIIDELGPKIQVVDQDVLNVMFYGEFKEIELRFNNDEVTNFYRSNYNRIRNYVDPKQIDSTVTFHYTAGKPWNNIFSGSCENVWYKYLKISPYKYLYEEKYSTLKYKLLRIGIMKYIFFKYTSITPYINKLFLSIASESMYQQLKQFYRKKIK